MGRVNLGDSLFPSKIVRLYPSGTGHYLSPGGEGEGAEDFEGSLDF